MLYVYNFEHTHSSLLLLAHTTVGGTVASVVSFTAALLLAAHAHDVQLVLTALAVAGLVAARTSETQSHTASINTHQRASCRNTDTQAQLQRKRTRPGRPSCGTRHHGGPAPPVARDRQRSD